MVGSSIMSSMMTGRPPAKFGALNAGPSSMTPLAPHLPRDQKDRSVRPRKHDSLEAPQGMVTTTTDPHLAPRIGEKLRHAHHGVLTCRYEDMEDLLRATWGSEAEAVVYEQYANGFSDLWHNSA